MIISKVSAMRSKDPNTQVGACLVDASNKIVGIGYNGFPHSCSDDIFPWSREGEVLDTKYPYVVHAEANAILNKNTASLDGCTLYTTLFPCNECAKLLIQSNVRTIVYMEDKYPKEPSTIAAKRMFEYAKVIYTQYQLGEERILRY